MYMNRVVLLGNLGRDPEVRSMSNGNKVANMSLATNKSWKGKDGKRNEQTEWHNIVVFGDGLIEKVIEPYVKKGATVMVTGELRTRKWEDQSGNTRYTTEVVLSGPGSDFQFNSNSGPGEGNYTEEDRAEATQNETDLDDEIPF